MNQINQGNEFHIIPFVFLFFIFFKWAPTIIRLFMLLLYMWRQNIYIYIYIYVTFYILPIPVVLSMTKILYKYDKKIFHVNNL